MAIKRYNEIKECLNETSNGNIIIKSTHLLNKPFKDVIVPFCFVNSEWNEMTTPPTNYSCRSTSKIIFSTMSPQELAPLLEKRIETTQRFWTNLSENNDNKPIIPQYCFGAYVPMDKCVSYFVEKLKGLLSNLPGNPTVETALSNGFVIGCVDGAVHDNVSDQNRNIMTYSVTVCSRFLIEKLCIYPTSPSWIITHAQCTGKETLGNLRGLTKFRFKYEENNGNNGYTTYMDLPFYDLGDGNNLYEMTGHSTW